MNWAEVLTIITFILVLCVPVISYFGVRSQMAKTGQEIQTRVRDAMHDENELLTTRLKRCEADGRRRDLRDALTIETLKKIYHIDLHFDDDALIVRDGKDTYVTRIKEAE